MAEHDTSIDIEDAPQGMLHTVRIRLMEAMEDRGIDADHYLEGSVSFAIAAAVVAMLSLLAIIVLAPSGSSDEDEAYGYSHPGELREVRGDRHEVYVDADPYAGGSGGGGGGGRGGADAGGLSQGGSACVAQAGGAPARLIAAVRRSSGFGMVTGWHGQSGLEPCAKGGDF